MGIEGMGFDGLEGVSPSFVEALYRRYRAEPNSIEPSWRAYFEGLESDVTGLSWARPGWPSPETDALTAARDPMQMAIETKPVKPVPSAAPAAAPAPVP